MLFHLLEIITGVGYTSLFGSLGKIKNRLKLRALVANHFIRASPSPACYLAQKGIRHDDEI